MSDHTQCIPTPTPHTRGSWEDQPVFRWLFLAHLPPELIEDFIAFGEVLYDGVIKGSRMEHDPAAHLRGVAADLDTAALFLDSYVEAYGNDLPGLANPAVGWQDRLQALAEEIRTAVGPEGEAGRELSSNASGRPCA